MFSLKLRRATFVVAAITAGASLIVFFAVDQQSSAQDQSIFQPKIETSYREVVDGNETRIVPESRVVYTRQFNNVQQRTNPTRVAMQQLPHERAVNDRVKSILGKQSQASASAEHYGQEAAADTKEFEVQLYAMLGEQFDAMHEEQQGQMDALAARLESLKQQHQAREEARDEIVRRRMNELLRQPDPLAWDPNSQRRRAYTDLTPLSDPRIPSSSRSRAGDTFGQPPSNTQPGTFGPPPQNPSTWNAPAGSSFRSVPNAKPSRPSKSFSQTLPGPSATTRQFPLPTPRIVATPSKPPQPRLPQSRLQFQQPQALNALPSRVAVDPTKSIEASLEKAKDNLYALIGRSSVDQTKDASKELEKAILSVEKQIQETLNQGLRSKSISDRIDELKKVIRAASKKGKQVDDTNPSEVSLPPKKESTSFSNFESR